MLVPSFFAPLSSAAVDGVEAAKNVFMEATGDKDRPWRWRRRPGLVARWTNLHGPIRGAVELDGHCYALAGERAYELFEDYTATELGTVAPDTRISIPIINATQVGFVSGGKLYVYNRTTAAFAQVTDADLLDGGPILGIVHADTYAIVWFENSKTYRISALGDFTAWGSADAFERSLAPDRIVQIIADQKELKILGSQTGESHWHSGAASFPYEPVPNSLFKQGGAATGGGCLVGDSPYWVGKSDAGAGPVFRVRGGYIPEHISTHWVERRIQALELMSDAYSYSFEEGGHRFYQLTFPNAGVTLAFNESVPPEFAWSEWDYVDPLTGLSSAHLGRCHFYAFGKHFVGSRLDGTAFEQSLSFYDDNGAAIRCVRRFRGPLAEKKRIAISHAELDCLVGVGLTTGQGSDPKVAFRISRDGGQTWGNERLVGLGAIGQYGTKVRLNKCGDPPDPGWEIVITDPVLLGWSGFHVFPPEVRAA